MPVSIGPRIGIEGEAEYRKALQNIIQQQKTLKAEMQETASAFDKNASAQEKMKAKAEALNKQIEVQKQRVSELSRMVDESTNKYGEADTRTLKWKQALAEAETELNNLNNELKSTNGWTAFGEQCKSVGDKLETVGGKIQAVGDKLTKFLTLPIVGAFTAATKSSLDFSDGMAKVYTIADSSVVSMEDMSDALLDLSDSSGKGAGELAEAAYQALSAGVATENAAGFVSTAADLAKAGFLETAGAVDVLTTIINAYGYSAEDAANIADQLVQTQNDGKTTVDQLAQSMGQIIPTASALNIPLEQLNAAYVLMTKQGINTANATTYLNGMFTELADGGSTVGKILKDKTGKTFGQLMEDGYSLGDVLGILSDSVEGNSEAFLNLWGNVRAGRGALSIVNGGIETFNDETAAMEKATGNVASALETLSTPGAKARKALVQLTNAGIQIGDRFAPYIEKAANFVSGLIDKWDALSPATQDNIIKFAAIAAAVGPVLSVIGKLTVGIGTLIGPLGIGGIATAIGAAGGLIPAIGAALAAIAPVAGVVLGVVAAVAAVVLVVKNWGKITEWLGNVWDTVCTTVSNAWDELKTSLIEGWDNLKTSTVETWNNVKDTISGAWDNAVSTVKGAIDTVKTGVVAGWNNIKTNTTAAWNNIKSGISTAWSNIKSTVTTAANNAKTSVVNAWNTLKSNTSTAWGNIKSTIQANGGGIKGVITTAVQGYQSIWSNAFSAINSITGGKLASVYGTVSSIMSNVKSAISDKIWGAWSAVKEAISSISSLFSNARFSFPHISLPHFSWSWKDIGGIVKIPQISVSWYKKAYQNPVMFTSPTVLGTSSGLKGFGDGRDGEIVIGKSTMFSMIRDAVASGGNTTYGNIYVTVNGAEGQDVNELADLVVNKINHQVMRRRAAFA